MAKVGLTKLELKKNTEVETIVFNEQEIEVKQYLPIEDKLDLIGRIVNASVDDNGYYNPVKIHIFSILGIIESYSNLNITDKQKEDVFKLYDLFVSTGLSAAIFNAANPFEIKQLQGWIAELIDSIYSYKNSILGMLDIIKEDYDSLNLDASVIEEKLGNKENLQFLKEVLDNLG